MAIGDALTAPTGVQNQMVGQPSRVPGYDQGYAQAPGMPRPTQPNPMGRPTAVVGGPAYFTPEGYNAPPQPTQAFMPTDRAPDPIGDQFMRQMQSPMGQQYQQQYEAIQAPMREAEMAQRAEEQAAQDARFQEMMDRIAELEGQVATPTEPTAPMPTDPYIPGQTPFPGIPDFIRNLDFSGLPDLSGIDFSDYDLGPLGPIINQYNDRMEMGEPEPIDTFIEEAMRDQYMRDERPDIRDLPPVGLNPPPGGFDGGEPRFTTMRENMPPPVRFKMPELPDFSNVPSVDESVATSFMPGSGMGGGAATDRESLIGKKIFGQTITPESFAGRETASSPFLRATPRPDLPTSNISGPFGFMNKSAPAPVMPEPNSFFPGEIPDFSNMDFSSLRNFNLR